MLTGRMHFPTPETMAERLGNKEGIQVRDHQVMDFAERYWDPCDRTLNHGYTDRPSRS